MTSQKKLEEVKKLKELFLKYRVISVGDISSLPSKQFQSIRDKLKPGVLMRVTKKVLVRKAIEETKEKDLTGLNKYLDKAMPVLLFSNNDPFKLYKDLKKSKSKAAAKAGQVAPNDLVIKAGPTDFPPGPIIGELGQVGIVAAVQEGKVAVMKEKTIVKEGEVISNKVASVLAKLGIEPMEIGLNLKAVYDDGTIYEKSVLEFDEEKLVNDIKLAHSYAINLALKVEYFSKETIKMLISKGYLNAKALDSKIDLEKEEKKEEPKVEEKKEAPEEPKVEEPKEEPKTEETPKEEKAEEVPKEETKPEEKTEEPKEDINLKKSDFDKDAEKAQELITKMKDEGEIKKSSSKKVEEKPSKLKAEDILGK